MRRYRIGIAANKVPLAVGATKIQIGVSHTTALSTKYAKAIRSANTSRDSSIFLTVIDIVRFCLVFVEELKLFTGKKSTRPNLLLVAGSGCSQHECRGVCHLDSDYQFDRKTPRFPAFVFDKED
jgi:hypothetical protein